MTMTMNCVCSLSAGVGRRRTSTNAAAASCAAPMPSNQRRCGRPGTYTAAWTAARRPDDAVLPPLPRRLRAGPGAWDKGVKAASCGCSTAENRRTLWPRYPA